MAGASQPNLSLDNLQKMLDFVRAQTDAEIANVERLFNRAKTMFGWLILVAVAVGAFLGISTYASLQSQVTALVSDGMKREVPLQIEQQLKKTNIDAIIQHALEQKTEAQFQQSIDSAVSRELNTPARKALFQGEINRHLDVLAQNLAGEYVVKINGVPGQSLAIEKRLSSDINATPKR